MCAGLCIETFPGGVCVRIKRGAEEKISGSGGGTGRHFVGQALSKPRMSFASSLDDVEIRELLGRLDAVAEKLSVFPAESLLVEYKALLKELLARAMKNFNLRRDLQWRRTDRNTYVVIEKVESALSELEGTFLQEGERSRTLRLMEEIKGCLISLLF